MKIGKFITTLAPSFKKKEVLDDMDSYRKELHDINLAAYTAASEFFKNWSFKDPAVQAFDETFKHDAKTKFKGNFIVVIGEITKQLDSSIDAITVIMKSEFADDIIKDGITYRKANLLQLSECISLFLRFSRMLLIWTYAQEQNALGKTDAHVFSKGQIEWLRVNRNAFVLSCQVLSLSKVEITTGVKKITDAVYTEGHDEMVATSMNVANIDPFQFFLVTGTTFNIFYHARMFIADWQIDRYKAAKEEQRSLSFRLISLKELSEGRVDNKVQLQIQEIEGILNRLNASIAKKEEDYAH